MYNLHSFKSLKENSIQIYNLLKQNKLQNVNKFVSQKKPFLCMPNSCALYIDFIHNKFEQLGHCFREKFDQKKIINYNADSFQRQLTKDIFIQLVCGIYHIENALNKILCLHEIELKNKLKLPTPIKKLIFSYEIIDEFKYLLKTFEISSKAQLEFL